MSSFFLHYTYLYQPKVMQNIAIQIRWSGKESNLTQPIGHQCYYASLDLSNDIETHGASTISTPCLPCGSSRFASPLSTQHNYYIKTPTICQVFFNLFLFFFWIRTPPPSCAVSRENLLPPAHLLSKTIGKMVSELPPASSVTSSPYSWEPCPTSCST